MNREKSKHKYVVTSHYKRAHNIKTHTDEAKAIVTVIKDSEKAAYTVSNETCSVDQGGG